MICTLVKVVQRIVVPGKFALESPDFFLKQLKQSLTISDDYGYPLEVKKVLKPPSISFPLDSRKALFQFECQVYYFKPQCGQLLYGLITGFDQHGNMLVYYGFEEGYVHSSQFPANFNFNRNDLSLVGPDRAVLKVGDLVKLRIVEVRKTLSTRPRLRFTMRSTSLGKL